MSSNSSDDIEDTVMFRVGVRIFWMEWLTNLTILSSERRQFGTYFFQIQSKNNASNEEKTAGGAKFAQLEANRVNKDTTY